MRLALWGEAPGFQRDEAGPISPDSILQRDGFVRNSRAVPGASERQGS